MHKIQLVLRHQELRFKDQDKYRTTSEITHEYSTLESLKRALRKYYSDIQWQRSPFLTHAVMVTEGKARLVLMALRKQDTSPFPEYIDLTAYMIKKETPHGADR